MTPRMKSKTAASIIGTSSKTGTRHMLEPGHHLNTALNTSPIKPRDQGHRPNTLWAKSIKPLLPGRNCGGASQGEKLSAAFPPM